MKYSLLADDIRWYRDREVGESSLFNNEKQKNNIKNKLQSLVSFQKIGDYSSEYHYFLSKNQLLAMGESFELNSYQILALILKGLWEKWSADNADWPSCNKSLKEILTEGQDSVEADKFLPDTEELFIFIKKNSSQEMFKDYTQEEFDVLIREMIQYKLHNTAAACLEIKDFIEKEKRNLDLRKKGTPEERRIFMMLKLQWLESWVKLSDLIVTIENRRLLNEQINYRWLKIFGDLHLKLEKEIKREGDLKRWINLKESFPEMTTEEIEEKVEEIEKKQEQEFKELKSKILLSRIKDIKSSQGTIDSSRLLDYKKECREVLKQLYFLLHPDCLKNNPDYERLTDNQKEQLSELWLEIIRIRDEELHYAENTVGYNNRSLEVLKEALNRARLIVKNAGIDTNVKLIIQGETLKDQIKWLEKEIRNMKDRMNDLRLDLDNLLDRQDVHEKSNILQHSEVHEKVKEDMKGKIKKYQEGNKALEDELKLLMGKTNNGDER